MRDVKTVFRDEAFMARIWDEANRRLSAEKPDVDQELGKVETQAAQTQARIDRYFEAFEAGTLKPALCNEKVQRLTARLEELEAERQALEGRRKRLALPVIDKETLSGVVVVSQADFRWRYVVPTDGPGFFGAGLRASMSPTIHSMFRSVSVTPAAIAGDMRTVVWMRQKL